MEPIIQFFTQNRDIFNFLFILIGTVIAAHLVLIIFKRVLAKFTKKTKTNLDDQLIKVIQKPVYWGVIIGGIYFAFLQLSILTPYFDIFKIITKVLIILLVLIMAISVSATFLEWIEKEGQLTKKQVSFLHTIRKLINVFIYFLGLIFVLQVFGISISPLIASLGIGGLAVGLALQSTLSNYFSGLYVVADGFIQPKDYIELDNGMRGYVVKIGWRNTIMRLWNNNLVMIPNAKIADSIIINYNEPQNKSSFIVKWGVAYGSDLEKVEKIALKIGKKLQKDKRFGISDYEPIVRCYEFGDSNIEMKLIMQSEKYSSHYLMKHECIKNLKKAFDKEKITIAFPTRSVEFLNKLK